MLKNISIALLLMAACVACDQSLAPARVPAGEASLEKVTFAYTFQPQSTLAHVAMVKGYFTQEGLDVQPLMHTYGKAALQAVLDGKADFATVAETPVMFSVLKGEKIFVLANIEASTTNNAIVANKKAGIAAPRDLKGKRIAFTPGTTSDFFLDLLLTANGLTRAQIKPVPLKPEEMQEAILNGRIDAASIWNYPLTQIKTALGEQGVIFYDREIYTETFNIAAKQDFVLQKPAVAQRFLRALIKAENFTRQQPAEAQNIMATATQIDKNLIRDLWDNFSYRVVLDQTLLITLEDEARWAIQHKLTEQTVMPDYSAHIYPDSLRAVKADAVRFGR